MYRVFFLLKFPRVPALPGLSIPTTAPLPCLQGTRGKMRSKNSLSACGFPNAQATGGGGVCVCGGGENGADWNITMMFGKNTVGD